MRYVKLVIVASISMSLLSGSGRAASPAWPNQCGDGRIDQLLDGFEDTSAWSFCCSDRNLAVVTLGRADGCSGGALAIDYDLHGGDWFVLRRGFSPALDLTKATHLRLALKGRLRGSEPEARHSVQVKLVDRQGTVYWIVAESLTDLPDWRPMYIDLREFTCFGGATECGGRPPLDRMAIGEVQLAVSRCLRDNNPCEITSEAGVLYVDELAAVDLRPGAPNRLEQRYLEHVTPQPDLRASTAAAILRKQHANGLVPAWFPEAEANYNTYSEALALLVFVDEYVRSGEAAFLNAARGLSSRLLALQLPEGKRNAGAWYTAYKVAGSDLVSRDENCGGDESVTNDIDRCFWIGNTAWAVMALARLRGVDAEHRTAVETAIAKAADWMLRQRGRITDYPGLVTVGLEGNLSTYFGLAAAGRRLEAEALGDAVFRYGWDPVEGRMKIGAGPGDFATAIDTAGSWGAQFLRRTGRDDEALLSQGYAATVLRTVSFGTGPRIEGYGDIAGPWTPTVEFGGQAAAAGILDANHVMQEIYRLQVDDGSFPGSPDDWYGGTVPPWTTKMAGVAPTAWVYFAQNGDPLACTPSATNLCLNASRFRVSVSWQSPYGGGSAGVGQAVPLTGDTGFFWFFGASNVELVLKVLDGRQVNGHFWVFYGALSDLEYTITITDTETGTVKTYHNPPQHLASVADTSAF